MKNHGLALNLEVTETLVSSPNFKHKHKLRHKTIHKGVSTFIGVFEDGDWCMLSLVRRE